MTPSRKTEIGQTIPQQARPPRPKADVFLRPVHLSRPLLSDVHVFHFHVHFFAGHHDKHHHAGLVCS